jgi:hypothetical protein
MKEDPENENTISIFVQKKVTSLALFCAFLLCCKRMARSLVFPGNNGNQSQRYVVSFTYAKTKHREFVRVRQEGKSSVINNAVFQGLRYEHGGDGHEAEVAINVSV